MRKFEITEEGLQELLNYLGSQQYAVVFRLIEKLQTLREIDNADKGRSDNDGLCSDRDCNDNADGSPGVRDKPKG